LVDWREWAVPDAAFDIGHEDYTEKSQDVKLSLKVCRNLPLIADLHSSQNSLHSSAVAVRWTYCAQTNLKMTARIRKSRIEIRTTSSIRQLIDRAVKESGSNLTEFAEASLIAAAQRVLADRTRFKLSADAIAAWEEINARPAQDLPGVRRLMERPPPFTE